MFVFKDYSDSFCNLYIQKYQKKFACPNFHYVHAQRFIRDNSIELEDWIERLGHYFDDPWIVSHSLFGFINKWPDLVQLRQFKGIDKQVSLCETKGHDWRKKSLGWVENVYKYELKCSRCPAKQEAA